MEDLIYSGREPFPAAVPCPPAIAEEMGAWTVDQLARDDGVGPSPVPSLTRVPIGRHACPDLSS